MTIKFAYITERDGLVFLCDKDGKELAQCVPVDVARDMAIAGRKACCAVADRMEAAKETAVSTLDFWQQVGHEPANSIYEAMLSAATVDVSAALVKVPERKPESRDYYNCNDEWNACLDELEGK